MLATRIITHRGLDPSRPGYFAESSREAFADQLARGYGLEFDVRLTKDGEIVVIHDTTLKRMTGGKDEREVRELSLTDLLAMDFNGSHLASLTDLLSLIMREQAPDGVSALHLKHAFQEPSALEALLKALQTVDQSKFLLFDVKIETARYLKQSNPAPRLAPSVAHPYDIERFSGATGGTLYTLDEVLAHRDLFDWVWLDEWDTRDAGGGKKRLYTEETFARARAAGLNIALVTPELHGTSPGLLGGEAHQDARDHETLMTRIREILALGPDAVCTDYPDEVRGMCSTRPL